MKMIEAKRYGDNDVVVCRDVYFPREDGSVTAVRFIGDVLISIEDDAPVVLFGLDPNVQWIEHEVWEAPILALRLVDDFGQGGTF